MEVPGIRRVRSRSIRGAAEISAQFDPSTDMVVALQQVQNRVAEMRGDLPADAVLTVERLTPAVFPVFILSMTGNLATADLNDLATYVVKPDLARVPGAGRIEVLASDTREVEVVLDPARLTAASLTVTDVADGAAGPEPPAAGGPLRRRRPAASRAGVGTVEERRRDRPGADSRQGRRHGARGRPGPGGAGRPRPHAARHRQRPRCRVDQHLAADRRQHPGREGRAWTPPSRTSRARCRPACASPRSTTWRSSSARRSPTCETRFSSAACWRSWCCWSSCATCGSRSSRR